MNVPKISIITPSYNQGKFIEQTIVSVLSQNYPNLEYIIIDGGSTDETISVIKKYETHLNYWISEKDNGQAHAINKGFRIATGDIIAWINSDDMYCPNAFASVVEYFSLHSNANVVVGNGLFMDSNNNIYIRKHPNLSPLLEKFLMMSIFQPSTFVKRIIFDEVGFLNENYQMVMDGEWFYRISRKFHFNSLNRDLSIFRWHPESKSSGNHQSELYKRYISEHLSVLVTYYPVLTTLIKRFPESIFSLHVWTSKIVRFFRRVSKGELSKLSDKKIQVSNKVNSYINDKY